MRKTMTAFAALLIAATLTSCGGNNTADNAAANQTTTSTSKEMKAKFSKKYTNADFYTDGKFNDSIAMEAIMEMLRFYDTPETQFLKENIWVTDFGLGDFENCGMGGIFWINDAEHGYFSHDIYLLPGQMIPEHKHVATKYPAKHESWKVSEGWAYNFSEVGEPTPDAPAIPESQKATTISKNCVRQNRGEILRLKEEGTFHFLYAGDEGAIVHEYANYHDNDGLRFTNTKAKM